MPEKLDSTGSFIHQHIRTDLGDDTHRIHTRFPPEPNGYLHIGHAKGICINFGMAKLYGGKCNLRFDDTNPAKEDIEYVNAIIEDIKWLGFDWEERMYYASDYFGKIYEIAESLILKGKAFVCDLTAAEVAEYRGSLSQPGRPSPYRDRPPEESLGLFRRMKAGEFPDGARTLRAKIDMSSPNINMRDPVIYRISHTTHHNTGDEWCIYPMYDYAHPLGDAIEGITHSMCSLEFEDHRPLYDWCVREAGCFEIIPRQIEFAKLRLTNTIMGKRYLKALVDKGEVDGWDDPRLVTLSGLRRRGITAAAIREFCDSVGVAKAESVVDYAQLEHFAREDLKGLSKVVMAVLEPVKLVIANYPEGRHEMMTIENHAEDAAMGTREVPFGRELYIERADFMEDAPSKFHRLTPGREVRLKGAYFVACTGCVKDADGNVTEVHCTYDPETRSGSGFEGRRVKGTIHWVSAEHAVAAQARILEPLAFDDSASDSGYTANPNSVCVLNVQAEPSLAAAVHGDRFQFIRNGYFCLDAKLSKPGAPVFNRTVALKSSYKPS
ncbi:MAG: glutamine--tRNA ligase/YqeY domain fusion protein [Defluviitaleaceae bacterium]|nr:glutamine--tRNA ligase/YqeY domain fusion protein [Defluviitaleaceae bacterium]